MNPAFVMKIGVIGSGAWGRNLVRNLSSLGVLAGVADRIEANRLAARELAEGIELFEDHADLLAAGYDAVAVATPAHLHFPIARDAIAAGCHVFVEKPLTLDPAEAEELVALAEAADRVLMVGHLLMYQPAVAFVKEFLRDGRLGRVFTFHQRRSKLGRVRSVENVLWSFGVHDVAVLLDLAGEDPSAVSVSGHAGIQPGIEDDVYLHLRFPGGAVAHLHNSWLWPRVERELIITGERGILHYDELNQRVLLHKKTVGADLKEHDDGSEVLFEGSGEPLKLELEHFIDRCLDGRLPRTCGRSGLSVVRVLARAEELLTLQRQA